VTTSPGAGWPPPWADPSLIQPPRRAPGNRTGLVLLAVLVALTLLAGLVAAVQAGGRQQLVPFSRSADSAALAVARTRIEAELPRLQAWVAEHRGLPWKATVRPEVLSDAGFLAALTDGGGGGPADLAGDPDDVGTTFAAMGLVTSAHAFYQTDDSATSSDVVGFYDDQTQRLVVRGTTWTPSMEYTLVHELTHALQDQSFDLSRLNGSVRTDDETGLTVRAVIEGDAERMADDYYDEQTTAWQQQVDADQGSAPASAAPIVDTFSSLPYAVGERFVDTLAEKGGNTAVDAAFTRPPTTSAQLVHAAEWATGTRPAPTAVPRPPSPPGTVADRGVLGQLGLWSAVDAAHPRLDDALRLDGWAGDSYVSTDDHGTACFVDDVRFTSATTRSTAVAFLRPWTQSKHVTVILDAGSGLRLSACQKG
jgi:hypothetical protein